MNTIIKSLYENYRQDVYRYLISLTHDQNLAEDLTSDVFVSAILSLPQFQGKSEIKTWLFSIARYKWYESLRRQKKNATMVACLECYLQNEIHITEDAIIKSEVVERIMVLLEQEKEQNKKIVSMRMEGYSFYEIAKECAISENSARVIDFRVRKRIREILEKEGFFLA